MNTFKPKIIALSCSPSKHRNSDTMLDAFISGIDTNTLDIEKIYLHDIAIDLYSYINKDGPGIHEEEFKKLIEKIKHAQGLIIATPTYNFSVPAHLKNFIDRLRFFALDFKKKNRIEQPVGLLPHLKTFFIVSGGTPTWAQKILFFAFPPFWLRGVFLYYKSMCYGAYYSGDTETFKNHKILSKCQKLGKKYGLKIAHNAHQSIIEDLFWRPPQTN